MLPASMLFRQATGKPSCYGENSMATYDLVGCSKRPFSKAAGESKPEAYPLGYVEDFDKPRTKLVGFFSILLISTRRQVGSSQKTGLMPRRTGGGTKSLGQREPVRRQDSVDLPMGVQSAE
jgi:hypothetical protein